MTRAIRYQTRERACIFVYPGCWQGGSAGLEIKEVGQTQAINLDQGLYIFQISQRQAPVLPRYEAIRNSVLLEYKRRGRDQALNSKLDQLWHSAQIIVAEVQ